MKHTASVSLHLALGYLLVQTLKRQQQPEKFNIVVETIKNVKSHIEMWERYGSHQR